MVALSTQKVPAMGQVPEGGLAGDPACRATKGYGVKKKAQLLSEAAPS